jgi:hypothetical protein
MQLSFHRRSYSRILFFFFNYYKIANDRIIKQYIHTKHEINDYLNLINAGSRSKG